jgi:hypothetical protein
MILLKLTSIKINEQLINLLGPNNDKAQQTVDCFINVPAITHFEQNQNDLKLTDIYFEGGRHITTPISINSLIEQITVYLRQIEDEQNQEDNE